MIPRYFRRGRSGAPSPRGFRRHWIDYTVEIDVAAADVFDLLADIDGWSDWVPGLPRIGRNRARPVSVGCRFSMLLKMPPLPLIWTPCRLHVLERERIEWGGGGLGSVINHRFEITELTAGRTRVRHYEYATNVLALVLIPFERIFVAHDRRWSDALARYWRPAES